MIKHMWSNEREDVTSSEKYSPDMVLNSTSIHEDGLSTIGMKTWTPFHTKKIIINEITMTYTAQSTLEPEPIQIVTDTLTEQLLTILFLFLIWLYICCANFFLLYVIKKEPQLHTPQYFVLSSYMICDLATVNTLILPMIVLVIVNSTTFMPLEICQWMSTISSGFFFSMAHMVGYMAYERFVVFFRPLTYNRYFNPKKIKVTSLIIHLVGQVYSAITAVIFGKVLVTTALNCQARAAGLVYLNPITTVLFFLPPAFMSGYVLARLTALISKHKAQVSALPSGNEANQAAKQSKKQVFSGKRAFKMIALVSGSFLGTTVPFVLIRVAIFSSGVTWKQTDARENMVAFAISRFCWLAVATLSSLANPAIYVYAQTDLRKLAKRNLGMKVEIAEDEASITQGNSSTV